MNRVLSAAWRDLAACQATDPEVFFPLKGTNTRAAKKVCQPCPVRSQCLEHAISRHENDGVWGGMSPAERRAHHTQHTSGQTTATTGKAAS